MTADGRAAQYATCRIRGHTASNMSLPSNPPWSVCKYCGTAYRYETKLLEMGAPGDKRAQIREVWTGK